MPASPSSTATTPEPQHKTTTPLATSQHQERRWVYGLIALFVLAITLPYCIAAFSVPVNPLTPVGSVYQGLLYNVDDQNVHLAWARQARDGHFLFRDLFTHESLPTQPLFNNLFCWVMGNMARAIPLVWAYHLLRVVCAGLALWWFWKLTARVTNEAHVRLTAVALAAFGGGTGFLAAYFPNVIFIDRPDGALMMPEAWTFTSALIFPLFIASMGLLVVIYEVVLSGSVRKVSITTSAVAGGNSQGSKSPDARKNASVAFFAAFLLANIHTYDAIPLGAALLLWLAYEFMTAPSRKAARPNATPIVAALLGTALPILYQLLVYSKSDEFRIKADTHTTAPAFVNIVLSYGPLLLLALYGAVVGWRQSRGARLMTLWVAVTLLLIYAPVSFARKMIEGVHLPLCLLASIGLWALLSHLKVPSLPRLVAAGAVLVMSISSLSFGLWCLDNAAENNVSRLKVYLAPLYLPPDDVAALRWLNTSTAQRDKVVLCMPWLGNYLPQETGRTVYLGHWAETLYFQGAPGHPSKLGEASRFFGVGGSQMTSEEARTWLKANDIGFVVLGFYEQQAGAKMPLSLPLAQRSGRTEIYRVD